MAKIHTRTKRRYGLSTSHGHHSYFHGIGKKNRPKTFKTEEAANALALEQGLKPKQYYLKNVKRSKKFQIMVYDEKNKNAADKEDKP